jgi:hypothetical protein
MNTKKPLVSKKTAKKIDTVVDVTQTPAHIARSIGYTAKSLAIANLPYHEINRDRWERKNGNYTFVVVALKEGTKIPFGVIPRLFFIWLITEITKTKSREIILGDYFNDFLAKIGYTNFGGKERARVRDQLLRLFSCAIGTYYDDEAKKIAAGSPPESFVQTYSLWTKDKSSEDGQQELFPARIVIKQSFFEEVMKAPIPIDMRIVETFKNSALKLDIYLWLTYRMFSVTKPQHIKYEDLMVQFGGDYNENNKRSLDTFRTKFRNALKEVLKVYQANVDLISPEKIVLLKSDTSVQNF